MSPAPSLLHAVLMLALRHVLLVLDGILGARLAMLRARRDGLPLGHRRRARMAAEMRRLARYLAALADPGLIGDAGFRGKAAEVARVCNDAGRRAVPRRRLSPTRYRHSRAARRRTKGPAVAPLSGAERCTIGIAAPAHPPGGLARAVVLAHLYKDCAASGMRNFG